jgi:hypothetical protein
VFRLAPKQLSLEFMGKTSKLALQKYVRNALNSIDKWNKAKLLEGSRTKKRAKCDDEVKPDQPTALAKPWYQPRMRLQTAGNVIDVVDGG